jgi:uncharacterized membrane protein
MMKNINKKDFAKKTLLGGLVILLPVALLVMGFRGLLKLVTDLIQPLTNLVTKVIGMPEIFADILVLIGMAGLCFCVGWLVTTAGGAWFHNKFDGRLSRYAPGYQMIKDIIDQFFGDSSKSPFANGQVAMVKLFGKDCPTEVTAIVTSKHENGNFTIFMPTGPNPTSGNIYHVTPDIVTLYPDISVSSAMRTIIACGAGTGDLLSHSSGVGTSTTANAKEDLESNKFKDSSLNLSDDCAKFLRKLRLNNAKDIAAFSYLKMNRSEGFKEEFVIEITKVLEDYHALTPIEGYTSCDWASLSCLNLGKKTTDNMNNHGYSCIYQLRNASIEDLRAVTGIGPSTITRIKDAIEKIDKV